jgi:hypothetical protein
MKKASVPGIKATCSLLGSVRSDHGAVALFGQGVASPFFGNSHYDLTLTLHKSDSFADLLNGSKYARKSF